MFQTVVCFEFADIYVKNRFVFLSDSIIETCVFSFLGINMVLGAFVIKGSMHYYLWRTVTTRIWVCFVCVSFFFLFLLLASTNPFCLCDHFLISISLFISCLVRCLHGEVSDPCAGFVCLFVSFMWSIHSFIHSFSSGLLTLLYKPLRFVQWRFSMPFVFRLFSVLCLCSYGLEYNFNKYAIFIHIQTNSTLLNECKCKNCTLWCLSMFSFDIMGKWRISPAK